MGVQVRNGAIGVMATAGVLILSWAIGGILTGDESVVTNIVVGLVALVIVCVLVPMVAVGTVELVRGELKREDER